MTAPRLRQILRCMAISTAFLLAVAPVGRAGEREGGDTARQAVVLLHGLARTAGSMSGMASALEAADYRVCNIDYPSRAYPVEALAADHVAPAIRNCAGDSGQPVHFVTHSLGGIIVRQLGATDSGIRIGRVVMLGPPNGGSEVVDKLGEWRLFDIINGPAGRQLGTRIDSLPRSLGPAPWEVGIIAGDWTINPLLSLLIPGSDDGKVSVESAKLEGMQDFLVIPVSHPFLMNDGGAIGQTIHFLRHGRFLRNAFPSTAIPKASP